MLRRTSRINQGDDFPMHLNRSRFSVPIRTAFTVLLLCASLRRSRSRGAGHGPGHGDSPTAHGGRPRGHDAVFPFSRGTRNPLRPGGSSGGRDRRFRSGRRHRHRGAPDRGPERLLVHLPPAGVCHRSQRLHRRRCRQTFPLGNRCRPRNRRRPPPGGGGSHRG